MFLNKTFYSEIILDLQKSHQDSIENAYASVCSFSPANTSHNHSNLFGTEKQTLLLTDLQTFWHFPCSGSSVLQSGTCWQFCSRVSHAHTRRGGESLAGFIKTERGEAWDKTQVREGGGCLPCMEKWPANIYPQRHRH